MALALLLAAGCGGKVIFDSSATGTAGGGGHTSSGSTNATTGSGSGDCVLGNCGDPCTKCTTTNNGTFCSTGKCDANANCQPPTTPVSCPGG